MSKSYRDRQEEFTKKAEELVSQMTLEEAASQLRYDAPPIKRLGIPGYNWWNEALHGVARAGTATMFPQAIGLAAMFDEKEIGKMAEIIAEEGRAKYNGHSRLGDVDIYKGLTFWSPNVNIFRDPRWGRGHETYGEDPYLTARLGVAYIKALQGDGEYMKAAACAKHYAVHSGPEAERHSFDARVSQRDLWDTYLPAFEACVCEAGVEAVMGAYNRTNGEPCAANKVLMTDILRGKWKFQGHFTSDCWAIRDFHTKHMVTKTAPESAALAVKSGCDLNCGNVYLHMMEAYQEGLVSEEDIRRAAVRLFTTRFKLGMFDEKCEYNQIPYTQVDTKEHNQASYEMSKKSIVLLKNDGILPLKKDSLHTIGVIGPNADNLGALRGNYHGTSAHITTNLRGIQDYLGDDVRVLYGEGCHLYQDKVEHLAWKNDRGSEAVLIAENSDVIVLCLGLDETLEGEEGDTGNAFASGDKLSLNLPEVQQHLLESVVSVGKPVVLVVNSGSALDLRYAQDHCAAVIQAWYSGPFGGKALAELLFGEYSPSGRLPLTFYQSTDQLPDFKDYSMDNRTYRYFKGEPLYPFGYGLSYTRFEYSGLKLDSDILGLQDDVRFTVTVKNAGSVSGEEVIEVYVKDLESSSPLPICSLCGFQRVALNPGESAEVSFTVKNESLRVVAEDGSRFVEPGEFILYVGGGQPDARTEKLTGQKVLSVPFVVKAE